MPPKVPILYISI